MNEALPIKDWREPLIIGGGRYFVVATETGPNGETIDLLKSEISGKIKKFERGLVLKSITVPKIERTVPKIERTVPKIERTVPKIERTVNKQDKLF